jgi:hypothetical protein
MGKSIKIQFDFDTSKSCEIYLEPLNDWFRVTPFEFRSWTGKRRIMFFDKENKPFYQEYKGPVYYKDSNYLYKHKNGEPTQDRFVHLHDIKKPVLIRPGERRLVEQLKAEGKWDNKNYSI